MVTEKMINSNSEQQKMKLGFRCDGSTDIGLGHVVGSIRLATLLARELGIGAEFVLRKNPAAKALIKEAGFSMEVLPGEIPPEKDINRLIEKKTESPWSGVVFNFCKADLERYTSHFNAIKDSGIALVFMDNPLPPSYRLGDLLINALPHPDYEGYDPDNHPNCLDGLEYFIPGVIGPSPERVIKPTAERVLIAMGGADNQNLTELVIKGLAEIDYAGYVDVVLGSASPHRESVQKHMKKSGLAGTVSWNVSDMYKRMHLADIGLSGLGLTTYEMAYTCLPACIVSGSELNANAAQQYVQHYGAAVHFGFYKNIDLSSISSRLSKIMDHREQRLQLSRAGYRVGKKVDQVLFSVSSVLNLSKPDKSKQEMTD